MPKTQCSRLKKIEADLVSKALDLYDRKQYWEFWESIAALDSFLSVKKGLMCNRKK